MRTTFQQELEQLEGTLHDEGVLALRSLQAALNALARGDLELADELIAFDDDIDALYIRIEEGIQSLLARQTPVARDLRLVLAILHVNLHLERIGDYCVTIAKLIKLVAGLPSEYRLLEALEEMGARAEEMISAALDSFVTRDADRAHQLVALDEAIDAANRRAVDEVVAHGTDPERREWGARMLMISRCLERIGDHTVDIAEQTAYLVTAEFHEFTDASHPIQEEARP